MPAHRSRRAFLALGAGVFALAPLAAIAAEMKPSPTPMKIGIVGSGRVGGTVGSIWVKAGHEVMFSSRHPEQLKEMADKLGPRARVGTTAQAIAFGDVIFLAVPYSALPEIGRDNAAALKGKVVVDASNPVVGRDGEVAREAMTNGIGQTSLKYLQGVRYARAFNPVGMGSLGAPTGGTPIGMPVAGDDPQAVKTAVQLVRDTGLEPVVLPLSRAKDFAPGTPIFGRATPVDELRKHFGVSQ